MDSYSILGVHKDSSMEEIDEAYRDKVRKIKEEVKNEKNAASFESVLTEAYNDILSQKKNFIKKDYLDSKECLGKERYIYNNYDDYKEDDKYYDLEGGQVIYEEFDKLIKEEYEHKSKKKNKNRKNVPRTKERKSINKNEKKYGEDVKYKSENKKSKYREKNYKRKNIKKVKNRKRISILSLLLLPLKILLIPIIIFLSIILLIFKVISLATWIVSKVFMITAISIASIHGYQIYMGAVMDIKVFIASAILLIVSIFLPTIIKSFSFIIEVINNKLKDFVF